MMPSPIVIIAIGSTIAISSYGTQSLYYTLVILLALLVARELFQFGVSPSQYVCSYENYVELAILTLLGIILFSSHIDGGTKRVLAAHALVLSWAEMLLLTGKHPRFSQLNMSMTLFVSVVQSYVYFLLWYLLLIISFAFGFHIILFKPLAEESDKAQFFQHPFLSVVKTTTMMIGDLDVSDLVLPEGNLQGTLSFVFLLIFVFMVVIILMNLLNALAVREIGEMEVCAETLSYVSRVKTVLFMETAQLWIHKCIKYNKEHWIYTVWHWLTNIKETRISYTDKFPQWSVRIQNRDGICHYSYTYFRPS
jgi:hypothetical protein